MRSLAGAATANPLGGFRAAAQRDEGREEGGAGRLHDEVAAVAHDVPELRACTVDRTPPRKQRG
jgi:hypothetical protein